MDWQGETVVIVATGPSANAAPLDQIKGHAKVIAINDSWNLCPWADVLYASDGLYWDSRKGVPEFQGLKVTASPRAAQLFGLMQVSPAGRGKHSGSHAIYLALDFGAKRIVLVGFDLGLLDDISDQFKGVEIINASPYSFLKNYPKVDLLEAVSQQEVKVKYNLNVVKKITIKGEAAGVEQTAASVNKLQQAYESNARATESTLSAQQDFDERHSEENLT